MAREQGRIMDMEGGLYKSAGEDGAWVLRSVVG